MILEKIDVRTHNQFADEAFFHGYKVPRKNVKQTSEPIVMSIEEEKAMQKALEESQARIKKRIK